MNAYEKLNGPAEKQEARDLAIMAMLRNQTFDSAWEMLRLAAEFLNQKEAQREVESRLYWESEAGRAARRQMVERFSGSLIKKEQRPPE